MMARLRERSTKPPATRPTSSPGPSAKAARMPSCQGLASMVSTEANARPSRAMRAPKDETVWAAQSRRKPACAHSAPDGRKNDKGIPFTI